MKVDPTKTELENFIALYNASDYATQYAIGTNPNLGTPTAITDPDYNTQIDITKDDGSTLTIKYNRLDLQDQINQVFFNGKSCFISDPVKSIEDVKTEATNDYNNYGYDHASPNDGVDKPLASNHVYNTKPITSDIINTTISDKLKFINNSVNSELSIVFHDAGTTSDFNYANSESLWNWVDTGQPTYRRDMPGKHSLNTSGNNNDEYGLNATEQESRYTDSYANTAAYMNDTILATDNDRAIGVGDQYFNNNGIWEYKVTAKDNSLVYINTATVSIKAVAAAISITYGLVYLDENYPSISSVYNGFGTRH